MEIHTRRQLLAALPAVGCGLAGCLGAETSSSRSSGSATEGPGRDVPDEQATTDPPMLVRRGSSEQPAIRLADNEDSGADVDGDDTPLRVGGLDTEHTIIDNAATADRLIADSPADNRAEADLASFVTETAFDSETLYLETQRVEQCYGLSLCYISWQSKGVQTDYSRVLRPYDEQCAVDTKLFESRLFRLPVALDADEVRGYGSSISSSRCGRGARMEPTESRPLETSNASSPNGSDPA